MLIDGYLNSVDNLGVTQLSSTWDGPDPLKTEVLFDWKSTRLLWHTNMIQLFSWNLRIKLWSIQDGLEFQHSDCRNYLYRAL